MNHKKVTRHPNRNERFHLSSAEECQANECFSQGEIQFAIDQETLNHLPPLYQEIAKVLIDRGKWVLQEER